MEGLSTFWFVLTALAVWRCVVFVRQDSLIEGTREKLLTRFGAKDSLLADKAYLLLTCQWCLSIWFAGLATLAWLPVVDYTWTSGVITWLALAATASSIDLVADRL